MSEYAFRSCLENIESDDYGSFKENYELGTSPEESEYLLRVAISRQKKFITEYLVDKITLSDDQMRDCQVFSSTGESLNIFHIFADKLGGVCSQAWMNLFNIRPVNEIAELLEKYGQPKDDLQPIIQYALANTDPQVHSLAFDKLFDEGLLDSTDKKNNMIDSICFSGNLDLLDKVSGTDELKSAASKKQEMHIKFAGQLDNYIEQVFQNTPKEKVAQTVNSLNLMDEIKTNPQVEDWDIIIQDYLVNEEFSLLDGVEGLPEDCLSIKETLVNRKLMLLELQDVKPSEYKLEVKDVLSGESFEAALDRRVFDKGVLYICYVVDANEQRYISSHPMFILSSKKNLLKLGLKKEKDRIKQRANKKKSKGKKSSSNINLSSKETFKFLLAEHIKSRKEIDDNV